jgi:hypothetical protein
MSLALQCNARRLIWSQITFGDIFAKQACRRRIGVNVLRWFDGSMSGFAGMPPPFELLCTFRAIMHGRRFFAMPAWRGLSSGRKHFPMRQKG